MQQSDNYPAMGTLRRVPLMVDNGLKSASLEFAASPRYNSVP